MKLLVLTLSALVAVSARPDVSHLPTGSYLPSTGSNIGSNLGGYDGIGINTGYVQGGSSGFGNTNFGQGFGQNSLVQDQKQVFYYAGADDEQASRLRIQVAPSSHKNTKVIFVKAPSAGGVIPEVIAPPSQSEDKTVVYVLVKKQQQGGAITIPSSIGVKSAKPEVYFIKYRNQQEAEQAVSSTLNGQAAGTIVQDLRDEQSFIRTIKDSASSVQGGGGGGGGGIFVNGNIGGGGDLGGGSNILGGGGSILGGGGSITGGGSDSAGRYGTPGLSGPYKR